MKKRENGNKQKTIINILPYKISVKMSKTKKKFIFTSPQNLNIVPPSNAF